MPSSYISAMSSGDRSIYNVRFSRSLDNAIETLVSVG